jgi:hypothetical protein
MARVLLSRGSSQLERCALGMSLFHRCCAWWHQYGLSMLCPPPGAQNKAIIVIAPLVSKDFAGVWGET